MSGAEEFEAIRGSGNVIGDHRHPNPDVERLNALLAAQIIAGMEGRALGTRVAGRDAGIAAADFSRRRRAKLDRFTSDRPMGMLGRLVHRIDIAVPVRPLPLQPTT